jgi:DNA-directed RNA polymerase specialized sigma24 family protein
MGLGLTLLTGLGTLPVLLILWALGTMFGVVLIAEALERTRGLAPATFGGAFWLACGVVVLLVLAEMARWFAPKGDKRAQRGCLAALLTRPLVAVLLLFVPCILLVRCDLGGTDVPDILTTTALLCALGYGLFVLPIAFVALTLRLARWLWRFGQRSSFRSGLVAGIGAAVGVLLPTCMVCTPPDDEADDPNEPFVQIFDRGIGHLVDEIDRKGLMEGSLSGLADASTLIPGTTGPWKLPLQEPPLESRLRSCVQRFTAAANRVATVEQAARWLVSNRRADFETANAVAYGTVLRVCHRHAREAVSGDLGAYFWESVKKNYCKDHGRNPLAQCSSLDRVDARCDSGLGYGSAGQLDAAIDLRARLCRLDPRDRDIVLRDFEGETSQQIAADLNMTAANVRKRLERAYEKMATH